MPKLTKAVTKATDKARNESMALMHLQGKSYAEIGRAFGMHRGSVQRALTRDDNVKELINEATRQQALRLPKVLANYDELLDSDDSRIKLEASRDINRNLSITPTSSHNTIITNITQNNNLLADPTIIDGLRKALADDIIDIPA